MNATTHHTDEAGTVRGPARHIELPAAVAVTWALAGGMLLGGASVAAMIFAGRMSPHLTIVASTLAFIVGAALGYLNGAVVGILGRPENMTARQAARALLHGMVYLLPAMVVAWFLAGWVAALPLALFTGKYVAAGISIVAWVAMLITGGFAADRGLRAVGNAFARWEDRVLGTTLVGSVLVALLAAFLIAPPRLWLIGTQLNRVGGVVLAVVATFWFYGPMITAALAFARRAGLTTSVQHLGWKHAMTNVAIAIAAGLGLTLLAIPFYAAGPRVATGFEGLGIGSALAAAVAAAFSEELLFRLIVLSAAMIVALRYLPAQRHWAVVVAIATAAVADLVLHMPAVTHLGLPGAAMALAFATARLAIPAVLFGYLYYRRGLPTAIAAHAAADAALVLLIV
jgi:hypothetical protein